jgi:energy-converting hydrogenase A subunit C
LYIKSPMGALVAMAYFVFSTISSNAIAHSIGEIKKIK